MQSLPFSHSNVKLTLHDIENLPHHRIKSAKEWSSACPSCGGEDRFLFWPNERNYWCRQCELSGFIDQEAQSRLTEDELADIERRKRQAEQAEIDRKRTALQKLQARRPDIIYHQNLNGKTEYVTKRWGIEPETIATFKVGYCHACPTSSCSDSITIPYYWRSNLINLRHRLNSPNGSGKYRPEAKGLPTAIFNADIIQDEEWLVLVEGEFKAMVLQQNGLPVIGIPGANNFKKKWLALFSRRQRVYVALDPGVEKSAMKIADNLSSGGIDTRLVTLPTKPDDFFTLYGGTLSQFFSYLENGRVIC
jgi:Zn ribbon nucleic-acid-binding protein